MNNKKAPNEQIAFKLFNVKLLDEIKLNFYQLKVKLYN